MNTRLQLLANMSKRLAFLFIAGIGTVCSAQQFVNLDFEDAQVPVTPPGGYDPEWYRPVWQALPGWHAFYGGVETNRVWHNNMSLGAAAIILFGPHFYQQFILEGEYSVFLGPAWLEHGNELVPVDVSISQTGLVPADAASLRFKIGPPTNTRPFVDFGVFLNGEAPEVVMADRQPRYNLFAADIHKYAGQTVELKFVAYVDAEFGNAVWLDSIEFSPEPIPEPGVAGFLVWGSWLFMWARRRGKGCGDKMSAPDA